MTDSIIHLVALRFHRFVTGLGLMLVVGAVVGVAVFYHSEREKTDLLRGERLESWVKAVSDAEKRDADLIKVLKNAITKEFDANKDEQVDEVEHEEAKNHLDGIKWSPAPDDISKPTKVDALCYMFNDISKRMRGGANTSGQDFYTNGKSRVEKTLLSDKHYVNWLFLHSGLSAHDKYEIPILSGALNSKFNQCLVMDARVDDAASRLGFVKLFGGILAGVGVVVLCCGIWTWFSDDKKKAAGEASLGPVEYSRALYLLSRGLFWASKLGVEGKELRDLLKERITELKTPTAKPQDDPQTASEATSAGRSDTP